MYLLELYVFILIWTFFYLSYLIIKEVIFSMQIFSHKSL